MTGTIGAAQSDLSTGSSMSSLTSRSNSLSTLSQYAYGTVRLRALWKRGLEL